MQTKLASSRDRPIRYPAGTHGNKYPSDSLTSRALRPEDSAEVGHRNSETLALSAPRGRTNASSYFHLPCTRRRQAVRSARDGCHLAARRPTAVVRSATLVHRWFDKVDQHSRFMYQMESRHYFSSKWLPLVPIVVAESPRTHKSIRLSQTVIYVQQRHAIVLGDKWTWWCPTVRNPRWCVTLSKALNHRTHDGHNPPRHCRARCPTQDYSRCSDTSRPFSLAFLRTRASPCVSREISLKFNDDRNRTKRRSKPRV